MELVLSDEGYGKNDYIETTRPLIIVTAPDRARKMSTCLSQLYQEHKRGINADMPSLKPFLYGIYR